MLKQFPYEPSFTIASGGRVTGYDIILKCGENGCASSILEVLNYIASFGVNVLSFKTSCPVKDEVGLFITIDFSGQDAGLENEVLRRILEHEKVVYASFAPRFRNIIYSSILGPPKVGGLSGVLFSDSYLEGITSELYKKYGKALSPIMVSSLGEGIGRRIAERYREELSGGLRVIAEFIKAMITLMGQGIVERVIVGANTMEFTVRDYWEDRLLKNAGLSSEKCMFTIGLLKGIVEGLTGRSAVVEEKASQRMGRPYTRFLVTLG